MTHFREQADQINRIESHRRPRRPTLTGGLLAGLAIGLALALAPSTVPQPPGTVSAAPAVDAPPTQISLAPVGHIGGTTLAVAAARGNVLAGVGPKLVILDPSRIPQPVVRGESAVLPGLVWDIEVAGSLAYVAYSDRMMFPSFQTTFGASGGLAVIDIADPTQPKVLAIVADLGARLAERVGVEELAETAGRAAAAEKPSIAGDKRPNRGSADPWGEDAGVPGADGGGFDPPLDEDALAVIDIAVAAPFVYLATDRGLLVLDGSNPRNPTLIGSLGESGRSTGDPIWAVAAAGKFVFMASARSFQVVDVSDPRAPRTVNCAAGFGVAELPSSAIKASGEPAASGDPATSARVPSIDNHEDPCASGLGGFAIEIRGQRAYLATSGIVVGIDIRRPDLPKWDAAWFGFSEIVDIAVDGRWIYGMGNSGDLTVIDSSRTDDGEPVGFVDLPGGGLHVAAAGSRVFVAAGDQGLRVVDVSDTSFPREIGAAISAPRPRAVALAGNHAFVADEVTGLQIFDVTNPARPQKVGAYSVPGAIGVTLAGGRAYVLTAEHGLRVVDVSNPARPREVGTIQRPFGIGGVAARGTDLFLSTHVEGEARFDPVIQVIDMADLRAPEIVATLPQGPFQNDASSRLLAQGGWLYAFGRSGLRLIEILDPHRPRAVGMYYLPRDNSSAVGLAVVGDKAYLAAGAIGFVEVDLAEPRNPVEIGIRTDDGMQSHAIAGHNGRAFVIQQPELAAERGDETALPPFDLQVLGLSAPHRPQVEARYRSVAAVDFDHTPRADIALSESHAYLADSRSGVYILRLVEGPRVFLPWSGVGR
jgi:hypothetical protein